MRIVHFIMVFVVLFACKNTNSPETPKDSTKEVDSPVLADPRQPSSKTTAEDNILEEPYYVLVDKLRVRNVPGKKGKVLVQLPEGAQITYLGETSDFKDRIKLRDQYVEAAWLKIKTEKNIEGWVFGGAVTSQLPANYESRTPFDRCEMDFVENPNYDKYYACIEAKAKLEEQKDNRYIKAHNNGYSITLLSGENVNLENDLNPEYAEVYRKYSYRYHLDKMGYFVFQIDGHETTDFILMDDKYGYVNMFYGLPRMSPDRQHLLIVSFEAVDSDGNHAIRLLKRGDNGLESIFEESIVRFEPMNPQWLDANNIEFDFLTVSTDEKRQKVKAKLTQVEPANWQLNISNRRE